MNYLKLFLSIFLLLSLSRTFALDPKIKTKYIYAQGGESLRHLLEYQVGIPNDVLDEGNYYEKIRNWNPNLVSSDQLLEGEQVYLEIPYDVTLTPKQEPIIVQEVVEEKIEEQNDEEVDSSWNYSIFYALSKGEFQEDAPAAGVSTSSSQDSPITLGLAITRSITREWTYSGSAYFSKLYSGVSNSNNQEVSIPLEYGINSYASYKRANWYLSVYSGIDYERFSSYNTDELSLGNTLDTREHNLTFLTLGVSKSFTFMNKRFLTKASFSQSVLSSQSQPSSINPEPFKGSKYIFYLNMDAYKRWFYHGFYKQHSLEGATSLQVSRFGLGFGYKI